MDVPRKNLYEIGHLINSLQSKKTIPHINAIVLCPLQSIKIQNPVKYHFETSANKPTYWPQNSCITRKQIFIFLFTPITQPIWSTKLPQILLIVSLPKQSPFCQLNYSINCKPGKLLLLSAINTTHSASTESANQSWRKEGKRKILIHSLIWVISLTRNELRRQGKAVSRKSRLLAIEWTFPAR